MIDQITSAQDVVEWMKDAKPFCAHCNSGNESFERWELVANHDLDEWVEVR